VSYSFDTIYNEEVNVMKYVISQEISNEGVAKLLENPEEAKKAFGELIKQVKPEAMYFSTIRRFNFFVVNVEDPHVELRSLLENLSKWGNVTIDPVSTFEEFGAYMESL
jgi:uncharacterized protein with GYD domain